MHFIFGQRKIYGKKLVFNLKKETDGDEDNWKILTFFEEFKESEDEIKRLEELEVEKVMVMIMTSADGG